ncbi:MAG: SET domain-containing protein-lysine N-methyltransferase [Isosphaerales bacterium]
MKIAVLVSSYERSSSPFRDLDSIPDPSCWMPEHQWERCLIDKATAVRQVRDLARRGFDAFVCFCDATTEEDRAGVEVVIELERLGAAYTGADPHFFEPTRLAMKLICPDVGVDTPRYVFAESDADATLAAEYLHFPLLVKHPNSYGSLGLAAADRVEGPADLRSRVALKIAEFGGALIEEFVEGKEFSVLVAEPADGESEPKAWTPVEVVFPPGESFAHFDLKWRDQELVRTVPVVEPALAERLKHAARQVFLGFKAVGYARYDLRMDGAGRLHMLDVNPNPCVFYPPGNLGRADVILSHSPGGHLAFLQHILNSGLRRREQRRPRWRLKYHPLTGFGMVAARDLQPGERIVINEEVPRRLVTRQYVERHWPDWEKAVFAQAAVPFSENVFRIWNENPEEWWPINHSCDPNAVFSGLDIIARRPIPKGEPITIEYATFCGPFLSEFTCRCGAATCRGIVRGTDSLAPWLEERYGHSITDYVRTIRARAAVGSDRERSESD